MREFQSAYANLAALISLHMRRKYLYDPVPFPARLYERRFTSSASSVKSLTVNNARSRPMDISGSGSLISVHFGGTEQ